MDARARAAEGLARFERALPLDAGAAVALRVEVLRALLAAGSHRRVVAVGRRGAGKTALLNALAGAPLGREGAVADATGAARAWGFAREGHAWCWVDTPGLRAGGRAGRREAVRDAARAARAHAVVAVVSAAEADAGIDDDLDDLAAVLEGLAPTPRLVAALTQVDHLAPPDVTDPPWDDAEKRENIVRATTTLHRHMLRHGLRPARVVPLRAPAPSWNVDVLARALAAPAPPLARELEALVRGLCEAAVAAFAAEATRVAAGGGAHAGTMLARVDGRCLDALDAVVTGFVGARAQGLRDAAATWRGEGAVTGALRAAFGALGARAASGAVAAQRVRVMGSTLLALEDLRPDEALVRELALRQGGHTATTP